MSAAELDAVRPPDIVRRMSRCARMLILLLVASWLPVTLHCRLEAAGFSNTDKCCGGEHAAKAAGTCKDDPCSTVEDALYKESSPGLKIAAPDLSTCFVCLALAAPRLEASVEPPLSPERHAPPAGLQVAWQFIARAAPSARAPSLNS